jgi:hypothetical protein
VIIDEQPLFRRKTNARGKPVGKATLTGFLFRFSGPLDPGSAADPAHYQVDAVIRRKGKKKAQPILQPITGFTVVYSPATDSVTLTLAGRPTFPTGGQVTVVGGTPGGVSGASSAAPGRPSVFSISPEGRSITPA